METEKRLIDAYALMDCIRDSKRHNPHDDPTVAKNHMFEHDHFMKMVSLAPTVNAVEVVHGEWSTVEDDYIGMIALECSKCKEQWWFEDEPPMKIYNYCPNCGAKMDGGADNGI